MSSDETIHTIKPLINPIITINSTGNRALLTIHPNGTVTGEIEDASEAARVFVDHIRKYIGEHQTYARGDEETYNTGKRDGYEQAVQDIDLLTGGDGEYRYCTNGNPERHTPDAAAMKARIAERFQPQTDALKIAREALEAFIDRFDGGARADTEYVAGLVRNALEALKETT